MKGDEGEAAFLADGGEMGALIRGFDWTRTPLGPPRTWPPSLRVAVRIMLNTRHPMFIWWGPDLIQFYNDAYSETMGPERHPSALGARGRECWDEIWPVIGPQIDFVMSGNGATWDEDRLVPVTRHGHRQNVWWTYSYGPIENDGEVGGVLVVCTDVTEQHLARAELASQNKRLELMFEQAPGFMAILRGSDHAFEFTNAAYRRLLGDCEYLGKPARVVVPEAEGQGFLELLDQVYARGVAHIGRRVPMEITAGPGSTRTAFLDFVYQPIVDAGGNVSGIFVEGADVTEHVIAESQLTLANDELTHRVKNTLAMVSAIARQTLRNTGNDGPLQDFHNRLSIFGKAHDIITMAPSTLADMRQIVEGALEPHRTGQDRFTISGCNLELGAKQALSLALALHELATNATKYGSLSLDTGKVDVRWRKEQQDGAPVVHFVWSESGGPRVVPPTSRGFGSQLIERTLSADISGNVAIEYRSGGVVCRWSAPLSKLTEATGTAAAP